MTAWFVIVLTLATVILIPFAPKLVKLRIGFFRWLGWDRTAEFLEKHFQLWVWIVRGVLTVVAVVLIAAYLFPVRG